MSDHVVHGYNNAGELTTQSIQSYQSVWMAHWAKTNCKSAPNDHCGNKTDDLDAMQHPFLGTLRASSDVSKCGGGFRETSEARTVNATEEGLPMSMNVSRKERFNCQTFPIFNSCQHRGSDSAQKNDLPTTPNEVLQVEYKSRYDATKLDGKQSHFPVAFAWAPAERGLSESHFRSKGVVQNPQQQLRVHNFVEKNSLAVSRSLHDEFIATSSGIASYRFNNGGTSVRPFMDNQERVSPSNFILASKEHFKDVNVTKMKHEDYNYKNYSSFFVCKKKTQNHLNSGNLKLSLFRQNDNDQLLYDASTRNTELPLFVEDRWQKMQNPDGIELFSSWNTPVDKLNHRGYSLQKLPCSASAHDVGTMRMCTAVDSLDGLGGCPPKFSQTTHHVVITKSDANLSKGGPSFKDSKVPPESTGNTLKALFSLRPDFGPTGQLGVKLQPVEDSSDSQGKKDAGGVRISAISSKNESSAETDTMNMDAFQEEKHLSGAASSALNKDPLGSQDGQTCVATIAAAREFRHELPTSELPDMNQELPALPAPASSTDDKETSTSRTQSLDVEHILAQAEEPINSKCSPCADSSLEFDPSSRWVKRLRVSASDSFGHGTKTLKMGETSSHEKVNNLFSKIMKHNMATSEFPAPGRRPGKEPMELDRPAPFLRNNDSSSIDSAKRSLDITLNHSWIRRWCRNQSATATPTPKKKLDAVVACEPQSSKVALDEFHEKQFPSIAAMALMGKTMTGLRPCELRKRGPLVVWDAQGS